MLCVPVHAIVLRNAPQKSQATTQHHSSNATSSLLLKSQSSSQRPVSAHWCIRGSADGRHLGIAGAFGRLLRESKLPETWVIAIPASMEQHRPGYRPRAAVLLRASFRCTSGQSSDSLPDSAWSVGIAADAALWHRQSLAGTCLRVALWNGQRHADHRQGHSDRAICGHESMSRRSMERQEFRLRWHGHPRR